MHENGTPLGGIYAAGEVAGGLFYGNYPGGSGLMAGWTVTEPFGPLTTNDETSMPAALAAARFNLRPAGRRFPGSSRRSVGGVRDGNRSVGVS